MITFRDVSYRYPARHRPALDHITQEIPMGARVLVTGPSGSGKSTLLRCPNGLVPHFYGGVFGGQVLTAGVDTRHRTTAELSQLAGFVSQEPESQAVTDRVEDEIAFGPENVGVSRREIGERVDELLEALSIEHLRDRELSSLSGGERQRVVIAAACALRPRFLALDEPTSQVDPRTAPEVMGAIDALNARHGTTVLISEHRLSRVLRHVDRLLRVEDGRVVPDSPPGEPGRALTARDSSHDTEQVEVSGPPRSLWLHGQWAAGKLGETSAELDGVTHYYGNRAALRDVTIAFATGAVTVLMGRNGSGKTTLLKHLNGILRPTCGSVRIHGEDIAKRGTPELARLVGYLPQHPGTLLFNVSVESELRFTLRCRGVPGDIDGTLRALCLEPLRARHPFDLSSGQRQRAALAAVLVGTPPIVALDEPTRGMDAERKRELAGLLRALAADGATVILATHDVELARACATRVVVLDQGSLAHDGTAGDVLAAEPALAAACPP